jgi:hypothetical protein
MQRVIKPEYLCGYRYDILQDDVKTSITVSITVPPTVSPDLVLVDHDDPITWIEVGLPGEIPFLAGRLFDTATSISCTRERSELIIRLGKDWDSAWRILVKDFVSLTRQIIDPQSAFVLSLSYRSQSLEQPSRLFLELSVRARFPPAVARCAESLSPSDPGFGVFIEELTAVARNYRDGRCCAQVGILGAGGHVSISTAIEYLRLGIELCEDKECLLVLGCLL